MNYSEIEKSFENTNFSKEQKAFIVAKTWHEFLQNQLVGILIYQPTHIKIENGNFADILLIVMFIVKDLCFLAMSVLPLYFRLWR